MWPVFVAGFDCGLARAAKMSFSYKYSGFVVKAVEYLGEPVPSTSRTLVLSQLKCL